MSFRLCCALLCRKFSFYPHIADCAVRRHSPIAASALRWPFVRLAAWHLVGGHYVFQLPLAQTHTHTLACTTKQLCVGVCM